MKLLKKTCAIICTRDKNFSTGLEDLLCFYRHVGIQPIVIIGTKSIFSAYSKAFDTHDTFESYIFCHDDIRIMMTPGDFVKVLNKGLSIPNVGFVGPAGTTLLGSDAVWWNHDNWQRGKHSGMVMHGDGLDADNFKVTYYGEHREVVALDGLFLAANREMLEYISLQKPSYFDGDWDFYDIEYTTTARGKGYKNYTIPIMLIHNSFGNLAGRHSWHNNRTEFIKNNTLPLEI